MNRVLAVVGGKLKGSQPHLTIISLAAMKTSVHMYLSVYIFTCMNYCLLTVLVVNVTDFGFPATEYMYHKNGYIADNVNVLILLQQGRCLD